MNSMKSITLPLTSPASLDKCYGLANNYVKGFITRANYERGKFKAYVLDELTNGNQWSRIDSEGLDWTITKALNSGLKVYEFDSYKELLEWLIIEL